MLRLFVSFVVLIDLKCCVFVVGVVVFVVCWEYVLDVLGGLLGLLVFCGFCVVFVVVYVVVYLVGGECWML